MPPSNDHDDDFLDDEDEEFEDDDETAAGGRCPICEAPAGECDHLVASIDRTFSEFAAGAIFAHERVVLDLLERLAATPPEVLKAAGAGPALEHAATIVAAEMEEGASAGDAVSIHLSQIMAALIYMLQEDGDVTITDIDAAPGEGSSCEYLWAEDSEGVVERLIERLQEISDEVEEQTGAGTP